MHHSVHVCDKWKEKITLKTDYLAWKMALTQYLQLSDDSDSITIFPLKKLELEWLLLSQYNTIQVLLTDEQYCNGIHFTFASQHSLLSGINVKCLFYIMQTVINIRDERIKTDNEGIVGSQENQ